MNDTLAPTSTPLASANGCALDVVAVNTTTGTIRYWMRPDDEADAAMAIVEHQRANLRSGRTYTYHRLTHQQADGCLNKTLAECVGHNEKADARESASVASSALLGADKPTQKKEA